MQVYVSLPKRHIAIHKNDLCQQVRRHQKEEQRNFTVRPENAEAFAGEFLSEKFVFNSAKEFNDLWFDISLDTLAQELEFVHRFQTIVGEKYKRLRHAPISIRCE